MNLHSMISVLVMSVVTIALRLLPFVIFNNKEVPKFITYLGDVLPYSIMGMLIIYCIRNIKITSISGFLPEVIAGVCVIILHVYKRNTLLSIGIGTVLYMFLVQKVFI